jgi:hypothetical protein
MRTPQTTTGDREGRRLWGVLVAVAAVVAAGYLVYAAVRLLAHIGDAGCDQLFSECIRHRQQVARGALGTWAAVIALAALRTVPLSIGGRAGRWQAVVVVAVISAVAFAALEPESHLDSRTEWLGV